MKNLLATTIFLSSLALTSAANAQLGPTPAATFSASAVAYTPNFKEIEGPYLSPATELALYKIHSHLKTCENQGFKAARLGVLWVFMRAKELNPKQFVNLNVSPSNIEYLSELNQEAQKNPNCSALTVLPAPGKMPKPPAAKGAPHN